MASTKILVPDMGDFKDVEVIEVLVKEGQQIKKNDFNKPNICCFIDFIKKQAKY